MAKHSYIRGQQRARLARRRQSFAWNYYGSRAYHRDAWRYESREEFWELQEQSQAEDFRNAKMSLDMPNGNWHTKRYYKQKYARQRRAQTRLLCYYALYEDEEGFDKITPEGFMGAIGWDLW